MSLILIEKVGTTAVITLNRPNDLNAISEAMANEMSAALDTLETDNTVRCIVFRGSGERAFSAGSDLKERRGLDADGKWKQARSLWNLVRKLYSYPKPTIAAVRGWCLGGGLELSIYCDIRIVSDNSVFGWPEMTLGAYPGSGGPIILPHLIGPAAAKKFMLFETRIDAARALEIGLVQEVLPAGQEFTRAMELAERVQDISPLGAKAVKQLMNETLTLTIDEANERNMELRRPLEGTEDYVEGIEAHFQKRKPNFKGR